MEKKLIFIDLDGTLTLHSTWFELNKKLGITAEEDHALFEKYLKEEHSYDQWIRELVQLYRNREPVSRQELLRFADRIELRPDAATTVATLREKGYRVVVLSGSVDLIVSVLASKTGANEWRATSRLVFDERDVLVDIIASGDEAPAKEKLAEEYVASNGYSLADAYAIDDGGNGVELFKKVRGIVLGSNEQLLSLAWKQVQTLSEIPEVLG